MGNEVMVSIFCTAYNQEEYIADAIESFLMQKTNFKYEIIVHDDASTDKTADIIRKYKKSYPKIVQAIFQSENQYSKNVNIFEDFMLPIANGKYIAICEGDDYWTDALKIQKQVDILEKNIGCDICAHTARVVNAKSKREIRKIMPSKTDTHFSLEEVINGDGGFVATNSLMLRKDIFEKPTPKFREKYRIDYSLQIMGSLRGGMIYLSECMSSYRVFAKSSWTNKMISNTDLFVSHYLKMISMLETLDQETTGRFHEIIIQKIKNQEFEILKVKQQYKELFSKEYKSIFNSLPINEKAKIYIKLLCPWSVSIRKMRINK